MAERMRFELTKRRKPLTHFPGALLKPLGHLSLKNILPQFDCSKKIYYNTFARNRKIEPSMKGPKMPEISDENPREKRENPDENPPAQKRQNLGWGSESLPNAPRENPREIRIGW